MITKTQKQTPAEWLNHRLQNAIKFALNYPTECELIKHDIYEKVYKVRYIDGDGIGWHHLDLTESLVRACMNWKGKKAWTEPTDYEDIFGRVHAAAERWKDKEKD